MRTQTDRNRAKKPRALGRRAVAFASVISLITPAAIVLLQQPAAAATGIIRPVAGTGVAGFDGDGVDPTAAQLNNPSAALPDVFGNILIADRANNRIRVIANSASNPGYPCGGCPWNPGNIYTIAGTGTVGYNGDDIDASTAELNFPSSAVPDHAGNLLIADTNNNRIRAIAVSVDNPGYPCGGCTWTVGNIYTIAGTGTAGYNGDGINATTAQLNGPTAPVSDVDGNIIVPDYSNHRVRVIALNGVNPGYPCGGCTWTIGNIYTIAGTGTAGYNGDGIDATTAQLRFPSDAVPDPFSNVVVTDSQNHAVRVVAVSGSNPGYPCGGCAWIAGNIYTIAGTPGVGGYTGDGADATTLGLLNPLSANLDPSGNPLVADTGDQRLRVVAVSAENPGYELAGCGGPCTWTAGDIYTIVGTGTAGFNGDDIDATTAQLSSPISAVPLVASGGQLLVSDTGNNRIRTVSVSPITFSTSTPPVRATVSPDEDAVWSVAFHNSSALTVSGTFITVQAFADGEEQLQLHDSLMPGCSEIEFGVDQCTLADIAPGDTLLFNVFVSSTGLTVGTTINGMFDIEAAGGMSDTGFLSSATIASCGTACSNAVATPGVPVSSSPNPPTATKPTKQIVTLPANLDGDDNPPIAIQLKSLTPSSSLPVTDRVLCPVTGTAPKCSGQISVVAANFSAYNDKARPVLLRIVARWGKKIPAGSILMTKPTGRVVELPKCTINSVTHFYNTPCLSLETHTGTSAANNLVTTAYVRFVAADPHFARRAVLPPGVPTVVKGTAMAKKVKVTWKAPASSIVTGYVVYAYSGTVLKKTVPYASTLTTQTIGPLSTGVSYTFKVAAKNLHGAGTKSAASPAVKPT